MEFVAIEGLCDLLDQFSRPLQGPTIDGSEFLQRQCVILSLEIIEVADLESQGIANGPVGAHYLFKNFIRKGNVSAEILRTDPETQDVSAVPTDEGIGGLRLAIALGDLSPFTIHDESMSKDAFVGSLPIGNDCRPEGGLEPTSMLIASFEV